MVRPVMLRINLNDNKLRHLAFSFDQLLHLIQNQFLFYFANSCFHCQWNISDRRGSNHPMDKHWRARRR